MRYFLVAAASGHQKQAVNLAILEDNIKQIVRIDELEVPSRKGYSLDQLMNTLCKVCPVSKFETVRQSITKFRNVQISAFSLLSDLEYAMGIAKGFKYFWAVAVAIAGSSQALEIDRQMKKSLLKMQFKDPNCILGLYGDSYWGVYNYLTYTLGCFLNKNRHTTEPWEESRINTIITNFYDIETGHLLEARGLQHYLSSRGMTTLLKAYFKNETELQSLFQRSFSDDLVVLYLYFIILKIKTCGELPEHPPGKNLKGFAWIWAFDKEIDVNCVPIMESNMNTFSSKEMKELSLKEDFPSLAPNQKPEPSSFSDTQKGLFPNNDSSLNMNSMRMEHVPVGFSNIFSGGNGAPNSRNQSSNQNQNQSPENLQPRTKREGIALLLSFGLTYPLPMHPGTIYLSPTQTQISSEQPESFESLTQVRKTENEREKEKEIEFSEESFQPLSEKSTNLSSFPLKEDDFAPLSGENFYEPDLQAQSPAQPEEGFSINSITVVKKKKKGKKK